MKKRDSVDYLGGYFGSPVYTSSVLHMNTDVLRGPVVRAAQAAQAAQAALAGAAQAQAAQAAQAAQTAQVLARTASAPNDFAARVLAQRRKESPDRRGLQHSHSAGFLDRSVL
jgi:hypothetical protein